MSRKASSFIADASDGKKAAISIDRYLQKASLTLKREQEGAFASNLFTRTEQVAPLAAVQPQAIHYTEAEAQQEAASVAFNAAVLNVWMAVRFAAV